MREKIYNVLHKTYGIAMSISFFAGFLPLIPFVIAIIIGTDAGEAIAVFLYKQYYPWVIALASAAVIIGLVAMYVGKIQGLSIKKINAEAANANDKTTDADSSNQITDGESIERTESNEEKT
jgi:thiol:disulfide interchange protein